MFRKDYLSVISSTNLFRFSDILDFVAACHCNVIAFLSSWHMWLRSREFRFWTKASTNAKLLRHQTSNRICPSPTFVIIHFLWRLMRLAIRLRKLGGSRIHIPIAIARSNLTGFGICCNSTSFSVCCLLSKARFKRFWIHISRFQSALAPTERRHSHWIVKLGSSCSSPLPNLWLASMFATYFR